MLFSPSCGGGGGSGAGGGYSDTGKDQADTPNWHPSTNKSHRDITPPPPIDQRL